MRYYPSRCKSIVRAFLGALLFAAGGCVHSPRSELPSLVLGSPSSGHWGIDACLTAHVPPEGRGGYLELLGRSGVGWLRERGPNAGMAELKRAGFHVVSFLGDLHAGQPRPGDGSPGDLTAVFDGAKALAKSSEAQHVDAWEMVGEPDVGYCIDLPDRLVAFQKVVYLGIKAGAAEQRSGSLVESEKVKVESGKVHSRNSNASDRSPFNPQPSTPAQAPLVLMGALALPPGPWLQRAMKNGLLDYTDAYNFHFYGNAEDLSGVIAAHARVAKRAPSSVVSPLSAELPLWITECGMNAVATDDFLNPDRRRAQAEFTLSTAKQALAAKTVAVFMPFILVDRDDPYALTLASDRPFPAWETYAKFTRDHPWPRRSLAAPSADPNPIVVQWMPDLGAAVAHKVSGTYRFWQRQPMHGEIRIYNFSAKDVRGDLRSAVPGIFQGPKPSMLGASAEVSIEAGGRVVVPVTFSAPPSGYARGDCEFVFTDSIGRESRASFGLETWPETQDFTESALPLRALPNRKLRFPEFPSYEPGNSGGAWQTINALRVAAAEDGRGDVFWAERPSLDPLMPAMAFAAVDGVPGDGFLRVQMDQPMAAGRNLRVDLVDADGQRFCIWENLGQSYFVKSSEVWLNVRDMQVYFWGHCTENPLFRPERVREIQLWFYRKTPGERTRVQLSWMTPRSGR